jgi:putative hydrolase of the HAD superfamily
MKTASHRRRVWSTGRDIPVTEHVKAILRALDETLAEGAYLDVLPALVDAYSRPILLVPPLVDESARPALEHLRKAGAALAIVSNTMRTPGSTLRAVLARHDLLNCFDHTVFSDEFGLRKPHPEIFLTALRAIGGEVKTAVHVGDDAILDVRGARAAGLRVIQVIPRDATPPPTPERPDWSITSFGELPEAIAALEAQ